MAQIGDNTRGVMLTQDSAKRIARAVQSYESRARYAIKAKPLRTASGDDGSEAVRMGVITGAWMKGDIATVTRLDGNGNAWVPADETFEAINHFANISVDCGSRKVACADVGGVWILIAAEC